MKAGKPWQEAKYTADNITWQGAAQRRRAHPRRTNVSLGICSVDLSGPHEPTPRPGWHIKKNPCHYFLALTVRPDTTAQKHEVACQTSDENAPTVEAPEGSPPTAQGPRPALIYAAVLGRPSVRQPLLPNIYWHK